MSAKALHYVKATPQEEETHPPPSVPRCARRDPAIIRITVNKRRSLTPSTGMPNVLPRAQARRGGVRQTASDRVTFRSDAGALREGWALNVSRGGLRAILDDAPDDAMGDGTSDEGGKIELGEEYAIFLGVEADGLGASDASDARKMRRGRIVWLQEEPDGFVVGVEYLTPSGKHLAAPLSVPAPDSPDASEPPAGSSAVDASGASGTSPATSEARVRADSSAGEAGED
jgi:hypothetical protein